MNSNVAATSEMPVERPAPSASTQREHYSWGRYPRVSHQAIYHVEWIDQVEGLLKQAGASSLLPYGLGRSYGDSCLNAERNLLDCSGLNRFLAADFNEGWICSEGGTSLASILEIAVPQGWFLPVTPGTKFVTIGGAIANDVHGKNHHHAGTFGCHVRRIGLCRSDGAVICGPEQNADLFRATIGGLGLTGVILWAEIQLKRIQGSNIEVETLPFTSLDQFVALTAESDQAYEYTVAWIDCLSGKNTRGIFFRGNHHATSSSQKPSARLKVPFPLPEWILNRPAMKMFNAAYFARNRGKKGKSVITYEPFFYPLDSVQQWNLLYGKRGFVQYQCVIPEESSAAVGELLDLVSRSGVGAFLGVLKRFGSVKSPGLLSFPRPGLTLALDFPMRGTQTLKLLAALDEVVMKNGGALYPAKDARMSPSVFDASFPHWRGLQPYIDAKLSSSFWRRVTGGQ